MHEGCSSFRGRENFQSFTKAGYNFKEKAAAASLKLLFVITVNI